jgi:hypothetical protein
MGQIVVFFFSCPSLLLGQGNTGELRLMVTDPSGLAVKSLIQIISEANQYRRILSTDDQGTLTLQRLPYGVYQLQINQPGFAEVSQAVDVYSSIPTKHLIQLKVVAQSESVTVRATNTRPHQLCTRSHLSCLPVECIGRGGRVQVRPFERTFSDRRAKPYQCRGRDSFWRSLFGERHRPLTQCGRTTDNELLGRRKPDSKDEASFLARRQKLLRGERIGQ